MRLSSLVSVSMGLVIAVSAVVVERAVEPPWRRQSSIQTAREAAGLMELALNAATRISAERGPANGVMGSDLPIPPTQAKALADARRATDQALGAVDDALAQASHFSERDAQALQDVLVGARAQLALARARVDNLARQPRAERSDADVRAAVNQMIEVLTRLTPGLNRVEAAIALSDPALVNWVSIARLTTDMRDYAGQLGSVFTAAFVAMRPLSDDEEARLEHLRGMVESTRMQLGLACQKAGEPQDLKNALAASDASFMGQGMGLVREMERIGRMQGREQGRYGMTAAQFAQAYVPRINVILELRATAVQAIKLRIDAMNADNRRVLLLTGVVVALVALSVLSAAWLMRQRLSAPLAEVAEAITRVARGEPNVPLPVACKDDEIAEVVAALHILKDAVQSRQMVERALRDAAAEQDALLNLAEVGIVLLRYDVIVRCNARFERLFRVPRGSLKGQSMRGRYARAEDFESLAEQSYSRFRQGHTVERNLTMTRQDGTSFAARLSARAIDPDDLSRGSVWVIEEAVAPEGASSKDALA